MPHEGDFGQRSDRIPLVERVMTPRFIAASVLAVLASIFILQNTSSGRINIYFWDLDMPRWLWLVAMLATGFIVGSLFPWFRRRS